MVSGHFEQLCGPVQIDVDIQSGLLNGRANSGPGRKMNDPVDTVVPGKLLQKFSVTDIADDRSESRIVGKVIQVSFFDGGIIVIIQIVETDDLITAVEQVFTDVAADKTGPTCNQYASRHFSDPLGDGHFHPVQPVAFRDATVGISVRAGEIGLPEKKFVSQGNQVSTE